MILNIAAANRSKMVSVALLLLIGGLLNPFGFDYIKPIVLSIAIIGFFGFRWIYKDSRPLYTLPAIDVSLLAFLTLSVLSIFWSKDNTALWDHCAVWSMVIISVILIRSEIYSNEWLERYLMVLLMLIFVGILFLHLYAVQMELPMNQEWNALFTQNKNYTTTYLTVLYPFLLFYKSRSQFVRFLKIICGFLLILLIFTTAARGAFIALCLIATFRIAIVLKKPWLRYVIATVGIFISIVIFDLLRSDLPVTQDIQLCNEFKEQYPSRSYLINNSLALFKQYPIIGVGAGQWENQVYFSDYSDIQPFNHPTNTIRIKSHNLYTTTLAQLGLMGLFCLLFPLIYILYKGLKDINELNSIQLASMGSLTGFMAACAVYATAVSDSDTFSNIHFLGFLSMGILSTSSIFSFKSFSNYVKLLVVAIGVLLLYWSVNNRMSIMKFLKADQQTENQKSIILLEEIDHLHHKNSIRLTPIARHLAKLYDKEGDIAKSQDYYRQAVLIFPNNDGLLLDYAESMMGKKGESEESLSLINRVIDRNKYQHKANFLLAKISMSRGDSTSASEYLNKIDNPDNKMFKEISQLYPDYKKGSN